MTTANVGDGQLRPSKDELRRAILGRVDTFTTSVEWIGGSAELAFADSVIALADWLATTTADVGSSESANEPLTGYTCPLWHRDADGWCIDGTPHLAARARQTDGLNA